MTKRLKVLVLAAATHPDEGSEPGLGWRWVEALSKFHDLWVITGEYRGNRDAIERRFREHQELIDHLEIFYIPWFVPRKRWLSNFCLRLWYPLYYRYYRQWHQEAYQLAKRLHQEVGFDLVHQLNMTGYREPGYLWKLDAPFVWGPVGGTHNVPLRFASVIGFRETLYHLAKRMVNHFQLRHHRRVHAALARANGFITVTPGERETFLRVTGKDSVVIGVNRAIPPRKRLMGKDDITSRPLQLIWSGIHQSRKALPLALQALAMHRGMCEFHLHVLGEGRMTQTWKQMAQKLQLDKYCTWHGLVEHKQAVNLLGKGDVLVFTSLGESTPSVVLESLSVGVPVICLDHCGMAEVVTPDCGVKIPVTTPKNVIIDLAETIYRLAKNPDEVHLLSEGALKRAREYSWDSGVQPMLKVYQHAIIDWQRRKIKAGKARSDRL
jgi:glycosyltransferase involved in cell wall biosynthesis